MARETVTRLVDDLEGNTAERTVAFGWEGTAYEIDLNKKNIAAFTKAIQPYVDAGRRARSTSGRGRRGRSGASDRTRLQEIRDWARANGHQVSDRGRIASTTVEAYDAAH